MPILEKSSAEFINSVLRPDDLAQLQAQDEKLLTGLIEANAKTPKSYDSAAGIRFENEVLASMAKPEYSTEELMALETHLMAEQTLNIPLVTGYTITVDGATHDVSLLGATELADDGANHGEMSKMFYLRDHIQAASALMELYLQDNKRYVKEGELGRHMLLSVLHCMATPAQLARFAHVIEVGPAATQEDWPHISLWFDDLQGEKPNGWRNKQDTLQMLAYLVLDALDRGFMTTDDLSPSHRRFLGSVVPLLAAVGFPNYESSGSWEEVAARRTSVMAIEVAIMHKITAMMAAGKSVGFLAEVYDEVGVGAANGRTFGEQVNYMLAEGLREVGRRLPFESPDYDKASVKHREADAALTYVLMYGLPQLLAENNIPIGERRQVMAVQEIEALVLEELEMLIDPVTNGMLRYKGDSYQRVNFHTGATQQIVADIKTRVKKEATERGDEVNLEDKQRLRDLLTPAGREASWVHPLGQVSAWAAGRAQECGQKGDAQRAEHYRALSTRYLNYSLSNVTGSGKWNTALNASGAYELRAIKPYRVPECYITYEAPGGQVCIVASPHTPLNWASVMLKLSIGLLGVVTERS